MQRTASKIQAAMIILLMALLFFGCGAEDLLEENNQRYQTDISFMDAEEEGVLTADVIYTTDCNADGVSDDPETFTDLFAIITIISSDAETPGLEMTGYKVTFKPLRSYDQGGNAITPPSVGTYWGDYSVVIPSNLEVEFTITCMETDQKLNIGSYLNALDWIFRYEVTIRMDFVDELNEPRDITVKRTIYFGAYDNC